MKKLKVPASVGAAVDFLYATREKRKMFEAQAAAVKEEETEIETQIFNKFKKADLDGARGKQAQASVSSSDVPTLDDWDAFAEHLKKNPADLDMLQRRLAIEAVRARWSDKIVVPGVGTFTKIKLTLTKVKVSAKQPTAPKAKIKK